MGVARQCIVISVTVGVAKPIMWAWMGVTRHLISVGVASRRDMGMATLCGYTICGYTKQEGLAWLHREGPYGCGYIEHKCGCGITDLDGCGYKG